eukprot:116076_1
MSIRHIAGYIGKSMRIIKFRRHHYCPAALRYPLFTKSSSLYTNTLHSPLAAKSCALNKNTTLRYPLFTKSSSLYTNTPFDDYEEPQIASGDWNGIVKTLTSSVASQIPVVGNMVSIALTLLWPEKKDESSLTADDIWDLIGERIKQEIDEKVKDAISQMIDGHISGLKDTMERYVDAKGRQQSQYLTTMIATCDQIKSEILKSEHRSQYIPWLISLACVHLSLLREQYEHGAKMYDIDNTDAWGTQLYDAVSDYVQQLSELYVDEYHPYWNDIIDNKAEINRRQMDVHCKWYNATFLLPKFLPEYQDVKGLIACGSIKSLYCTFGPVESDGEREKSKYSGRYDIHDEIDALKTYPVKLYIGEYNQMDMLSFEWQGIGWINTGSNGGEEHRWTLSDPSKCKYIPTTGTKLPPVISSKLIIILPDVKTEKCITWVKAGFAPGHNCIANIEFWFSDNTGTGLLGNRRGWKTIDVVAPKSLHHNKYRLINRWSRPGVGPGNVLATNAMELYFAPIFSEYVEILAKYSPKSKV